jgi:dihydroorotate dehydrogenase electron transfer subunit
VSAAPRTEPRTLAPPERRTAHVTAVERLGAYWLITALDAAGPPDPRPGQFYMLAAAERWGGGADERPYLPRAFSHARAREGRLSFLLEAVGPGTERLARLHPGEGLDLVGPLGIGWRPAERGTRPLLVGGGIGAAPLLCLQDELAGEGARDDESDVNRDIRGKRNARAEEDDRSVLLGFRSAAHAEAASLFAGNPAVATDDGSAGRRGLVTDLLREELDRDPAATVFACGPPAMLEAVRALCADRGVAAQLAMESGMACGYGACFGCVVPTKSGYVRLCVDGPVLDADALESALFAGAGH